MDTILSRGEFYTAYTPYQAEVSQGTLQSIYEFQSMVCLLTGMDSANASLYDGATALAEAAILAVNHTGKKKILLSKAIHPEYMEVVKTYFAGNDKFEVIEIGLNDGLTDIEDMKKQLDQNTAMAVVQNPNFFGCIENLDDFSKTAKEKGALLCLVITEATSLGLLKPPGECGFDISVGELQGLGLPLSFGGPYLGFMALKNNLTRKIPGRVVGKTVDKEGQEGYVLTLQAREQHIRRDKASSNICSNQALCALAVTCYLSLIGEIGFRKVAQESYKKAHYLAEKLSQIKGFSIKFDKPFYNEFVLECPENSDKINEYLIKNDIIGGLSLKNILSERDMLLCATEVTKLKDIDKLCKILKEINNN